MYLPAIDGEPDAAQLVAELGRAAGSAGLIAGQVADMELCPVARGIEGLQSIHLRKTAALFTAAVRMGAICGGADDKALAALTEFARSLGLAFQVVDDLLDVTADAQSLGKTPGKDARDAKRTAVAELGQAGAEALAADLAGRATTALASLGGAAEDLVLLAKLLTSRRN